MMNSLVHAGSRGRKKLGGSFVFRPSKVLTVASTPFFKQEKKIGWWEGVQVAEENVTIRKFTVHPDPLGH